MTNSICALKRLLSDDMAGLPHPEPLRIPSISDAEAGASLPRPVSSPPNVADSGRISFGAGFRLRSGK
jgi:hypothetical protein